MSGHVLTPLDGSRFGELALPYAATIAEGASWSLHLVHVHVPDPRTRVGALPELPATSPAPEAPPEEVLGAQRSYLRATARRLGLQVESAAALVGDEGVAPAIRDHARSLDRALVVMSTHGRTGMDRFWLGSVADALVRTAPVPILLVRPGHSRWSRTGLAGVDRVLVPLDTAGVGEEVLETVLDLGASLGWRVLLLHVVPTRRLLGARSYPVPAENLGLRRRRGREYLRGIAARIRRRGVEAEIRVVEAPTPDRGILEVLEEEEGVDLVAMATHGRGGLTRAILGSVADRVLAGTSLPLLVARRGESTLH